jgi:AraC-like DNA-binding protein
MTLDRKRRIPQIRFDARTLEPEIAFEYWMNVTTSYSIAMPDVVKSAGFDLTATAFVLDDVVLGEAKFGTTVCTTRHRSQIRADHLDHYKVALFGGGTYETDVGGKRIVLDTPGQLLITDMAQQETVRSTGSLLELYIPRDRLDEVLPHPMNLHGVAPKGPAATLFATYFVALSQAAATLDVDSVRPIVKATVELLAGALTAEDKRVSLARPVVGATVLRQICRYIDLHLGEPELSSERLCAFFGVSRSTLYRLFEPMGGVASFILERRLARIHTLLMSGSRRPQLSRLAEAHGFVSASHFSRAYRAKYGGSPSSVWKTGTSGGQGLEAAPGRGLQQWLSGLRSSQG